MTTFSRLTGPLWYPPRWYYNNDSEVSSDMRPVDTPVVDGTRFAIIFRVPKTGTLDGVVQSFFRMTTGQTYVVSWQDVDLTTGFPDGTEDQSVSVAAPVGTVIAVESGSFQRAVTAGDLLAVVWRLPTYAGGFAEPNGLLGQPKFALPYYALYSGASWSFGTTTIHPLFALRYADGTYDVPLGMAQPHRGELFFSDPQRLVYLTSGLQDEVGIKFSLPFDAEIDGAAVYLALNGNGVIALYDASDVVLASGTVDADRQSPSSPPLNLRTPIPILFDPITLTANTTYRLTFRATDANQSACFLHVFTDPGAGDAAPRAAWYGGTAFGTYTHRVGMGSWSDEANVTLAAHLFVLGLASATQEEDDEDEDGDEDEEVAGQGAVTPNILLVYSVLKKRWAIHDHAAISLYTEEDTDLLTAGFNDGFVYELEQGLTDDGSDIEMDVETKDFMGGTEDTRKLFQWARIDSESRDEPLTVRLYVDDVLMRTTTVTATRDPLLIPFPAGSLGYAWRVRASYTGDGSVKLYGAAAIFQMLKGA